MTEGKGYCARRQERINRKKLDEFVRNKEHVVVIPDTIPDKAKEK
jgi:hypothetical protein